jgi:hypothetical protein
LALYGIRAIFAGDSSELGELVSQVRNFHLSSFSQAFPNAVPFCTIRLAKSSLTTVIRRQTSLFLKKMNAFPLA